MDVADRAGRQPAVAVDPTGLLQLVVQLRQPGPGQLFETQFTDVRCDVKADVLAV